MSSKHKFFIPRADRRLGDRYELLECLGDGSYGWVWRATRLNDGEIVAVKIPKAQGATKEELAEGTALMGQEPHPNVISVYWMDRVPPEREWYAIEMEYFPSLTLSQLLDRGEQGFVASYERILGLYEKVLRGVAHLHSLGMSHGDIKPQNILVSGESVKLTDFGCSTLPDEMYARTRENGGTILYSAPEIAGSRLAPSEDSIRFMADVYSLGVLLYHLCTASLPHDTLSQVARHVPFPRARELNSSVSPDLDNFIMRCLKHDPKGRWSSVAEMLEQYQRTRRAQLSFSSIRTLPPQRTPNEDWSSQVVRLMEEGSYYEAENVSRAEYKASQDNQALLTMVTAAYRETRYFDCLRDIESRPDLLESQSNIARNIRRLALSAYLETRQVDKAHKMVALCLKDDEDAGDLLLKKASILGLQAQYSEAADLLLHLNRRYPSKPAILRRLIAVFEQLRDTGKAAAFLKAYTKLSPEDSWAQLKMESYHALGVR